MLVLHTWTTPNGKKVPILMEELGLAYELHFVDISKDEQFEPNFLAISPNNKIEEGGNKRPFVVDQEIIVGPSQSAGPSLDGGASSAKLTTIDQEIVVGPSQNSGGSINGGTFSPTSPNVQNTTQNTVVNQVYGTGSPINVNV